jgi:hypothetical protein
LDNFWTIFGQVLDKFWTSFGQVFDKFWTSFGKFFSKKNFPATLVTCHERIVEALECDVAENEALRIIAASQFSFLGR